MSETQWMEWSKPLGLKHLSSDYVALNASGLLYAGRYDEAETAFLHCLDIVQNWHRKPINKYPGFPARKVSKFVYLPVEISARELQSKAVLAGQLAGAGYTVLLGAVWAMFEESYDNLPAGTILFKTLNAHDAHNVYLAQKAGHLAVVLNEEFFGINPEQWIYEAEIHPSALKNADLICAQGEEQAGIYRSLLGGGDAGRIRLTGSPRAGNEQRVGNNQADASEILICCMAGTINNTMQFADYMRAQFDVFGQAGEPQKRIIAEQVRHECQGLALVFQAARELAKDHPDTTVRVRPHPSENPKLYEPLKHEFANIVIDDRTPFLTRLAMARLVVHLAGCGTGVEGALFQVPTLRLGAGGHGISGSLSQPYGRGIVRDILDGRTAPVDRTEELARHFAPCVLGETLIGWLADKTRLMKLDLTKLVKFRPPMIPTHFHTEKFPDVPDETISQLSNAKVQRCGWRLWTVQA